MRERVLAADDLHRGMFVSVKGVKTLPEPVEADFGDVMLRMSTSMEATALGGMILRVEHIDLPHIAYRCACGDRKCKVRGAIDMRKYELVEISREFVKAMQGKRWWQFWRR